MSLQAAATCVLILTSIVVEGCTSAVSRGDQPERGQQLFLSAELTPSLANAYSCSTCHDESDGSSQLKPGAVMAGVTHRPSFWGGQEQDLLRAINDCRRYFMAANVGLESDDPDALALYAFLDSLKTAGPNAAIGFTVVRAVSDLPRGDATPGQELFARACANCHGQMHTGLGRLAADIPVLPEETLAAHATYSARSQRLVFIEKVRHGVFLGYGGSMPPFSSQVLSDNSLSSILEALEVTGQNAENLPK